MKRIPFLFVAVLLLLAACTLKGTFAPTSAPTEAVTQPPATPPSAEVTQPPPAPAPSEAPAPLGPLTLTSSAFANEGDIPMRYGERSFKVELKANFSFSCDNSPESENISPALSWINVPPAAKSLALLMLDQMNYAYPEVPVTAVFTHWVIYNILPSAAGLPEGVTAESPLADGSLQGLNDFPEPYQAGYGGPCPGTDEKHLYVFTLYALDTVLDLQTGATMDEVKAAMEGYILAQAELKGYYLYH
jgi:Raf kinase inhibitor-like YbhB/YbcL family protein